MRRLAIALMFAAAPASAGEWNSFRGPAGTGVSDAKDLPTSWSQDENVRWKATTPGRSVSSPVVFKDRVYVTSASGESGDRLHVQCFAAADGKLLWERKLTATGNTGCHPKSSMAAPTPVADASGVYALFATADLAALDHDGDLKWYRSLVGDYPTVSNQVGMASSPVLVKDTLIVPMDNTGDSFLAAAEHEGRQEPVEDGPAAQHQLGDAGRLAGAGRRGRAVPVAQGVDRLRGGRRQEGVVAGVGLDRNPVAAGRRRPRLPAEQGGDVPEADGQGGVRRGVVVAETGLRVDHAARLPGPGVRHQRGGRVHPAPT